MNFQDIIMSLIAGAFIAALIYACIYYFKSLKTWEISENIRRKQHEETILNIEDKNLKAVVYYLNEQQKTYNIIFIVIFILLFFRLLN